MQQMHPEYRASSHSGQTRELTFGDAIKLDRILAAARRQFRLFLFCCVLGLGLGVAYLVMAVPQYTARANLLMDDSKVRAVQDIYEPGLNTDTGHVDSQVELLKSEKVANAVIDQLALLNDPAFSPSSGSVIGGIFRAIRTVLYVPGWFRSPESNDEFFRRRKAVDKLAANLQVSRVRQTYVLQIAYTSPEPEQAAAIANAFAEAYLTDQLDSKYEATRRASAWLQNRVEELRRQSLQSDLAVQKFKETNKIVASDGRLVSDQQITELSSQMMTASAKTAETEAKYQRVKSIIDNKEMNAAVAESMSNPVTEGLREKYLAASKREQELRRLLGPDHVQVGNLRNEMAQYERLVFEELGRMAQSLASDLQIAKAKQASLSQNLTDLSGENVSTNKVLVELRDLEREADTYRKLYQNFLQKYQETVQQQSFPITEARVITRATKPIAPSAPGKAATLGLALVLGGFLGAGVGAVRESRDRVFRTGAQVREELGLDFFGLLPRVDETFRPKVRPKTAVPGALNNIPSGMRYVLDHPLSGFTEVLRTAKVASDLTLGAKEPKIIGIISALPSEGKSTVSKNFASLLAHLGSPTLLIDGDLRNPGLTKAIAPLAEVGLIEVALGTKTLADVLLVEPDSGLRFLPSSLRRQVSHTSDMLASQEMGRLLAEAGSVFKHIVIDLPPLGPVVDVRAFAPRADAFIFVTEWGKTARKAVRNALAEDEAVYRKTIGILLNKVNESEIRLYENYSSSSFYHAQYKDYYRSGP